MNEIKIVRATVRGIPDTVAIRDRLGQTERPWVTWEYVNGWSRHGDEHITNQVPLRLVDESKEVVIPANADAEEVHALRQALNRGMTTQLGSIMIADALRSMLKPVEPPIPPEPEGDWIAKTANGLAYVSSEVRVGGGWVTFWKNYGPVEIYRREES